MYDNVIVPFDSTVAGRTALAPAGDLAWRCGGRMVIVTNTDASDKASKAAIKTRAMSQSGADADFWVDLEHSLGTALVQASKFRTKPIICVSAKGKTPGLLKGKRWSLPSLVAEVLEEAAVPVLVVGPDTDTSRGLPMTEIVVSTDGSAESEQIIPLAVEWAKAFKLKFTLIGVASDKAASTQAEVDYLESHLHEIEGKVPEARCELVRAPDPIEGILKFMELHDNAILAMSTRGRSGAGKGGIGNVPLQVISRCKRAVLLRRPA